MATRSLALLGAAVVAVGVAGGGSALGDARDGRAATPRVDLRISIAASAKRGAPVRVWRLRCDPDGGSWPSVGPACGRLRASMLRPITIETRDLVPITPQPVVLGGRAFGRRVSLRFAATGSSTRRARLRELRTALGERAYASALRRSR